MSSQKLIREQFWTQLTPFLYIFFPITILHYSQTVGCISLISSNLMFVLCPLAMMMLHRALLNVLQIFFDNFQTEFRVQEITGKPGARDVDENADIFQFDISALYQLQPTWISRCWFIRRGTWSCARRDRITSPGQETLGLTALPFFFFLVMSASLFPVR